MFNLTLASAAVFLLAAAVHIRPSLSSGRRLPGTSRLAAPAAALAGMLGIVPAFQCLLTGKSFTAGCFWGLPFGALDFRLDPLSAWFAVLLYAVAFLGAWHGKEKPAPGGAWSGYFLLCAGMLVLLLAADAVLFLLAWEIMSLAAWLLAMNRHRRTASRRAGWYYFIVTHASTACLMLLTALFWKNSGGFNFSGFAGCLHPGAAANAAFILAVLGFGCKAGFFGSHLWMPEAYNAAAGHNSALLSAIMSKLSFYALLRFISFFPEFPEWWGGALMAAGALTALGGIVYALMQERLKRLLAYSSMENLGLICLAFGFALTGLARGEVWGEIALLGMLLHIWHHGLCKTGLFLCASNVAGVTHGAPLDELGGLQKNLPRTALAFVICAAAICPLPPLSGFAGEYLMISSGLRSLAQPGGGIPGVIAAIALCAVVALAGGLAAYAFAKAYGTVFLGEKRSARHLAPKRDFPLPSLCAAALCLTLGAAWWAVLPLARPVCQTLSQAGARAELWQELQQTQMHIALAFTLLGALCLLLIRWRARTQARAEITDGTTWACGYSSPDAKIQYTGTSFVQPLTTAFSEILRPQTAGETVTGYFPQSASRRTEVRDLTLQRGFRPLFHRISALFAHLRVIQHGKTHLYIFYIMAALAAALVWGLAVQ